MPTDTQVKALLKKWKDAKPLTLTKTGVSEELRTIKADDPSTMTSCATFLKKKQADAKFKGQK